MIDHLSASQINLYLQCSLKYRYQYIDLIPRPFKSSGLAFGSVMHSALEWLHKEKLKGNGVTLDRLYKIFESDWFSLKVESEIFYKDGEDEMKLLVMGKELLGLYFDSPVNGVMGAEVPFHLPLKNITTGEELGVRFEGIIDLIEADDVIVEFKTSGRSIDPQSLDDYIQLTAYAYAYRLLFGKEPSKIKIFNFIKARTPRMAILETTREKKDYERLYYLAQKVLEGIMAGYFFPRTSYLCKDCEYSGLCKKWKGN